MVVGYRIQDNIGVGVEYGAAITAAISPDSLQTGILGINLFGLNSYLAKGWYQFGDSDVIKPYASVGLGLSRVSEPDVTSGTNTIVEGQKRIGLGANFELGVNIKSFNLSYGFNVSGKAPKEPVFTAGVADLGVNYHRFGLGYIYNF